MNEQKLRLKKLEHLASKLDGIVLLSSEKFDSNFFYLTNFSGYGLLHYDFSKTVLFSPSLDFSRAKRSWSKVEHYEKAKKSLKKLKGKKIGVAKNTLSVVDYEKLRKYFIPVDISNDMETARSTKTKYEIEKIKKACKISEKIIKYTLRNVDRKMTEIDLKNVAARKMIDLSIEQAYPTIVATGKNITEPHHVPDKTKLGETVLIDLGVKVDNYGADLTRTVGSRYENLLKEVIEEVLALAKPGVRCSTLHKKANEKLGKLSKYFITSLGHGFGLDVHERPNISVFNNSKLEENMIITIEPGIYVKNGIRLEDDYLVTKNGCKNISRL